MNNHPIWVRCICGDWWCIRHEQHAHDCEWPPVDEWTTDPYTTGRPESPARSEGKA